MIHHRTIRPLQVDDIDVLKAIDDAAHGESWSRRTFVDEIERDDRIHVVATCDDAIVGHGAVLLDRPSARVTNVAVTSGHGGAGHGSALLGEIITASVTQPGITNLLLEVRPTNRRAQRMYSRFGFLPVGIERNFYDRPDARGSRDAVVMAVVDVHDASWRDRLTSLTQSTSGQAA